MKVTPNSSPPPNDEGEYEPISKTEDTGDQLIGKFQHNLCYISRSNFSQSDKLIGLNLIESESQKHQFENPSYSNF